MSKQAKQFDALNSALIARGDDDSRDAAKIITPHIVDYATQYGLNMGNIIARINAPKGAPDFVAQKSIKRALRLLQGVGSGVLEVVPAELTCEVINNAHFKGEAVSNELARSFLSRTMQLDDETVEKLARKGVKISARMRKSVSTASAQASSIKGALRFLGVGEGVKHARVYGAINYDAPLMIALSNLIATATK